MMSNATENNESLQERAQQFVEDLLFEISIEQLEEEPELRSYFLRQILAMNSEGNEYFDYLKRFYWFKKTGRQPTPTGLVLRSEPLTQEEYEAARERWDAEYDAAWEQENYRAIDEMELAMLA